MNFVKKQPTFTFGSKHKIKDVLPHQNSTDIEIANKDELKKIIDEPCLKACEHLFEKNIQTVDSGCNAVDSPNSAYIVIRYDTLDEKNKKIADKLVDNISVFFEKRNGINIRQLYDKLRIEIPTTPETTVSIVEQQLMAIVKNFISQKRIIKRLDLSELIAYQQKMYEQN